MTTIKPLVVLAAIGFWACLAFAQTGSPAKKAAATGKGAKTPAMADDASDPDPLPAGKTSPAKKAAVPKPAVETEPAGPRGASWHAQDSYAEILRLPNKAPLLAIHYPWKVLTRPSVEVRPLLPAEPDTSETRPLGFVYLIMKGDVFGDVYQVRDRAGETPTVRKLKYKERDYELVGDKNRLGSGSVYALFPPDPDNKMPVSQVVFPLLGDWATDDHTLMLELPEKQFADPCWLRVWFLREGDIVWWKTIRWPGK